MEEQKLPEQEQTSKVREKFTAAMTNLTQVLGGQTLYKPTVLVPDDVQKAVIELAKVEKEKKIKEFQEKAIELIQKKRAHDKHVTQMKKDFEKKEEDSMKDFTDEANKLFSLIKDIKNIERDYYDTLLGAAEGKK